MAKYVYPAVFTEEDCGYSVNFPNLPNCFTSGQTLGEAIQMANDVLCLTLYEMEQDGTTIPEPSGIRDIPTGDNAFVNFIPCDTVEYRKFFDNKAVKKNADRSVLAKRHGRAGGNQLFCNTSGCAEAAAASISNSAAGKPAALLCLAWTFLRGWLLHSNGQIAKKQPRTDGKPVLGFVLGISPGAVCIMGFGNS